MRLRGAAPSGGAWRIRLRARTSPTAALDAVFASHAALTLAHILPAMAFVLLTPFVLSRRQGAVWAERLFFPLGVVVGITAYAMSVYAVGGWVERSAVLFFNSLFLFSLGRAYGWKRRGETVGADAMDVCGRLRSCWALRRRGR